jgi:uncharacterized membrane protein YidH (DUF202 family)
MGELSGFIARVVTLIIQPLVVLLLTAGVAYFIWGVAMYIFNADNADERKKGTQHLVWSLLGIVIMVGVIGILRIVTATFGVQLPSR